VILVDSNVLLRRLDPAHVHQAAARDAVRGLIAAGEALCVASQNLAEFWVVATRPRGANGLGLDAAAALADLARIEQTFQLLPDSPAVHQRWRRLIEQYRVTGRRAWDVRLLAIMQVHDIRQILTFNGADFAPFEVEVLDPGGRG
jgi:predicted nucleic acid-binding protein